MDNQEEEQISYCTTEGKYMLQNLSGTRFESKSLQDWLVVSLTTTLAGCYAQPRCFLPKDSTPWLAEVIFLPGLSLRRTMQQILLHGCAFVVQARRNLYAAVQ